MSRTPVNLPSKKVMVLGGLGQVGSQVVGKLERLNVKDLILVDIAATKPDSVRSQSAGAGAVSFHHCDVFEKNALKGLIELHQPNFIVDCINTATAISYRNVFSKIAKWKKLTACEDTSIADLKRAGDELADVSYIPKLAQHIRELTQAFQATASVETYVKVGTSGTGGMGLHLAYTHGEESPSDPLLAKAAVAGAQTNLLWLLSRTANCPQVKEVVPAAAVGWSDIKEHSGLFQERPVRGSTSPSHVSATVETERLGEITGSFVDTGENGLFTREEFDVLSSVGQMEMVTPEEIAEEVINELSGNATGYNMLAAMDGGIMHPSYRGGALRRLALEHMQVDSGVALGFLGPPRLSKLLFEAKMLQSIGLNLNSLARADPQQLSKQCCRLLQQENSSLLQHAVGIGIPALLADGTLLRGSIIKTNSAESGWIDTRPESMQGWTSVANRMLNAIASTRDQLGSASQRWNFPMSAKTAQIYPAEMVSYIFNQVEEHQRMRD